MAFSYVKSASVKIIYSTIAIIFPLWFFYMLYSAKDFKIMQNLLVTITLLLTIIYFAILATFQFKNKIIVETDKLVYIGFKKETVYFSQISGIYEVSSYNNKKIPEITKKIPYGKRSKSGLYIFGEDKTLLLAIKEILDYKNYEDLFAKLEQYSGKKVERGIGYPSPFSFGHGIIV